MPQRPHAAGLYPDGENTPCPCADAHMLAPPPPAEWMPLDEVVTQWTALASHPQTANNTLALHVLGEAFTALALEQSAHHEWALTTSTFSRQRLRACAHDLQACLDELTEAGKRWVSVAFWLHRLDEQPGGLLELVRTVAASTRTQCQRIEQLQQRVQEEQARRIRGLHVREGAR